MKEQLLERIVCPQCLGRLQLDIWKHEGIEIEEGLLTCDCGESYPVIKYVPRLLLAGSRQSLHRDYGEFFQRCRQRLPPTLLSEKGTQCTIAQKTQRSFGYEWTRYAAIRPEWEQNFWGYMTPLEPSFFRGKTVLDAGCGMGRHLIYSSQFSEMAVGVDFSRAVDVAYSNTRHVSQAHVVQADLLHLPFPEHCFDFIYSLGVLHHIPETDEALERVAARVVPGGDIRIYLYWNLESAAIWKRALLGGVSAVRQVTTRMPHAMLALACQPITAAAWLTFVLPYKILSASRLTRPIAESLPLRQYAQYPYAVMLNDQFDRFSAPLEKRYSASDVRRCLEQLGLEGVTVTPHWGWLGHGKRATWGQEGDLRTRTERSSRSPAIQA